MTGGVLCSGSIVFDTLACPVTENHWGTTTFVDTIEHHLGGNGANTSLALATLGIPVRLLGAAGRDDHGKFLLNALRAAGVDTSLIAYTDAATAATIVMIGPAGERKFLHRLGASAEAFPTPLNFTDAVIDGMSHYHLASLFLLPNLRLHAAETLARARRAGLATSLDTNWDPTGRWMLDLAPCLEHVDMLFINEDEARMTTGSSDTGKAAAILLNCGVRMAVMKLGRRGCAIYTQGCKAECPAFDVEARDTTGAGDCFVAGFLAARLRGASIEEAGTFANAVAALSVQRIGGAAGVPPMTEVAEWMSHARVRK
jgi:sugar/nucleoside kinase (ribokinase family)